MYRFTSVPFLMDHDELTADEVSFRTFITNATDGFISIQAGHQHCEQAPPVIFAESTNKWREFDETILRERSRRR
jgi:hypothetical protein